MGKKIKTLGLKRFKELDNNMIMQEIPKYYREKYGKPFHLTVLLQVRGNIPGLQKKRPCDIDDEIRSIPGINPMKKFFSCVISPKLKIIFGDEIMPKPKNIPRGNIEKKRPVTKKKQPVKTSRHQKARNPKKGLYQGDVCMGCYKSFEVDIVKHPSNLCGCLECFPNGVGFSKTSTRANLNQRKTISAA